MLPACLVSSLAFMLPVSSGPNALAFPHARISTLRMAGIGAAVNAAALVTVVAAALTLGDAIFDFGHFPEWAEGGGGANDTSYCAMR